MITLRRAGATATTRSAKLAHVLPTESNDPLAGRLEPRNLNEERCTGAGTAPLDHDAEVVTYAREGALAYRIQGCSECHPDRRRFQRMTPDVAFATTKRMHQDRVGQVFQIGLRPGNRLIQAIAKTLQRRSAGTAFVRRRPRLTAQRIAGIHRKPWVLGHTDQAARGPELSPGRKAWLHVCREDYLGRSGPDHGDGAGLMDERASRSQRSQDRDSASRCRRGTAGAPEMDVSRDPRPVVDTRFCN